MRTNGGSPIAALGLVMVVGCESRLSSADPAGPQAERISDLTWLMTGLGTAVFLAVVGFLFYALRRGSQRAENASGPEVEKQLRRGLGAFVAATTAILLFLLIYNFQTGRALAEFSEPEALVVRVVGHQWWWEVEYLDPQPHRRFVTANELHIPVGRRVRIEVTSRDVIHSFWAPNLHGKLDLIPGYTGSTVIQADEEGVYMGRCAEFCGLQHARMDFRIIAESPRQFADWYENQLKPAPPPADSLQQVGSEVFLGKACVLCHTVRGTPAGGRLGPDLTHLAMRTTIAAGTLPNTRGHLGGWVLDPQSIKPGTRMPANQMTGEELQALLAYLESLR